MTHRATSRWTALALRKQEQTGVYKHKGAKNREGFLSEGEDEHGSPQTHTNRTIFNLGNGARWHLNRQRIPGE